MQKISISLAPSILIQQHKVILSANDITEIGDLDKGKNIAGDMTFVTHFQVSGFEKD